VKGRHQAEIRDPVKRNHFFHRKSPYTVESHRTNLMQKLNLHNTAEIVLYAVRKNIIVP